MNSEAEFVGGFFVGSAITFLIVVFGIAIPFATFDSIWHKEAIQHQAAHYDPVSGRFTWNDNQKAKPEVCD